MLFMARDQPAHWTLWWVLAGEKDKGGQGSRTVFSGRSSDLGRLMPILMPN